MFFEQRRAALSLFVGLDRPMLAVLRTEDDRIHARLGQRLYHLFASRPRQLIGKESTVPDDHAHRHFLGSHINPFLKLNVFSLQKINAGTESLLKTTASRRSLPVPAPE